MVRQIPITALRAGCSGRVSGNSKHLTQFVWISCEGWARKSYRRSLGGVKWQLKKRWNARTQAYTLFFPLSYEFPTGTGQFVLQDVKVVQSLTCRRAANDWYLTRRPIPSKNGGGFGTVYPPGRP